MIDDLKNVYLAFILPGLVTIPKSSQVQANLFCAYVSNNG